MKNPHPPGGGADFAKSIWLKDYFNVTRMVVV